ncbi:hypothetical protein HBI56_026720 [Parastagonospora nodorum]|nr:hypothetical protein HBI13_160760 [Parastagonospora nodorum]KAH4100670.1 hypothetical protein HBH46_150200 [Parastagonospora nodorum]KAH4121020.1 hypothetical protein HBH47_105270 [Parastagonospora nodorum]KAH4134504.1 hypothetical protein HBH45_163070 [Parastagonospora nodorum]KAH4200567.1 hypothetical protein HBI95_171320 [Parastagonospora nodorum]
MGVAVAGSRPTAVLTASSFDSATTAGMANVSLSRGARSSSCVGVSRGVEGSLSVTDLRTSVACSSLPSSLVTSSTGAAGAGGVSSTIETRLPFLAFFLSFLDSGASVVDSPTGSAG